jgi:hypothetical protein
VFDAGADVAVPGVVVLLTEKQPPPSPPATDSLSESGRGLLLVEGLADDWGISPRRAAPGKTVWAELHMQEQGHPRTHPVAHRCFD